MGNSLGYFESNAEKLRSLFPDEGFWHWDHSFSSMLTVLREEQVEGMRDALESCMNDTCSYRQEAKLSPMYRGLLSKLMGIRPEQSLHYSQCGSELILFAAYWPWLGSNRVSIRVGVYNRSTGRAEEGAVLDLLKTIFKMQRGIPSQEQAVA